MRKVDEPNIKDGQAEGQAMVVTVVNEDNGKEYPIRAGKGTPIRTIVKEMYKDLKVERNPGDRLRCEEGGESVFPFEEMHLGDYLKAGHCPDLVWLFAGEAGGAEGDAGAEGAWGAQC